MAKLLNSVFKININHAPGYNFSCLISDHELVVRQKDQAVATNKLNGTWIPVRQQMNGTALPAAAFEKQQLIISDSTYTVTAESIDKGVVKYKDYKMDIYGREGVMQKTFYSAL